MDERDLVEAALAQLTAGDGSQPAPWPPVARRIKEARERAGLSESEIAARLGMTASEYWDIELHDDEAFNTFAIADLAQLAEILGMPLDTMLFGTNPDRSLMCTTYAVIVDRLLGSWRARGSPSTI